jgi:hypothetical protein
MKVYIYIRTSDVVILSGLLTSNTSVTGDDLTINYTSSLKGNRVMVSLTSDQFVYLQDQGVLVTEPELLIN